MFNLKQRLAAFKRGLKEIFEGPDDEIDVAALVALIESGVGEVEQELWGYKFTRPRAPKVYISHVVNKYYIEVDSSELVLSYASAHWLLDVLTTRFNAKQAVISKANKQEALAALKESLGGPSCVRKS